NRTSWDAATNTYVHEVKVFDAQTGEELRSIKGASGPVAFSPDGKRLASVHGSPWSKQAELEVKVWDAQTGKELLALKGRNTSAPYSPDGKRLATIARTWDADKKAWVDPHVKVWDAQTGQELSTLKGANSNVVFSPDGSRLAAVAERTVKVW